MLYKLYALVVLVLSIRQGIAVSTTIASNSSSTTNKTEETDSTVSNPGTLSTTTEAPVVASSARRISESITAKSEASEKESTGSSYKDGKPALIDDGTAYLTILQLTGIYVCCIAFVIGVFGLIYAICSKNKKEVQKRNGATSASNSGQQKSNRNVPPTETDASIIHPASPGIGVPPPSPNMRPQFSPAIVQHISPRAMLPTSPGMVPQYSPMMKPQPSPIKMIPQGPQFLAMQRGSAAPPSHGTSPTVFLY